MKVQGHEQGTIEEVTAMMDAAVERGVYVAADAYPYLAGQTSLAALIIPGWAQEGGREATRARFASPDLRTRIVEEADAGRVATVLAANTELYVSSSLPAFLDGHLHKLSHSRLIYASKRILGKDFQLCVMRKETACIVATHAHSGLSKVIGAKAKEFSTFG